jgi:hypothetical protein
VSGVSSTSINLFADGARSFQVGAHYHASKVGKPIAQVSWHPWGYEGSTLLVMTSDGSLRYAICLASKFLFILHQ